MTISVTNSQFNTFLVTGFVKTSSKISSGFIVDILSYNILIFFSLSQPEGL